MQQFHEYLYARIFKLVTDNKPLMRILNQNAKLPQMTSARLQRYAAFLSGYSYEIIHKNSSVNQSADCFSRAPVNLIGSSTNFIDKEVHQICNASINQISSRKLNFKAIQRETQKHVTLSKILFELQNNTLPDSEYTIHHNVQRSTSNYSKLTTGSSSTGTSLYTYRYNKN